MSRRVRHDWILAGFRAFRRRSANDRSAASAFELYRRLRFEPLEDRRLLANVTVGNTNDVVNGNVTSIAALIGTPGADGISLREAIQAANATAGADDVTFAAALSGATITLGGTNLQITEALTIDARPLAANVTINANQLSRIFNITATTGDFTLGGLTLTGGKTTATGSGGRGGAIRSLTTGNLTLDQSTVSGNSTTGNFAYGGGVFAKGTVTLTQSTVSGNSTTGQDARGGGIMTYGAVTLTQSTVSGNSTAGSNAYGGGIRAGGAVTLAQSTVSGNSTAGSNAKGGAIWTYNGATLTQSTLSGNSTTGYLSHGGGIWAYGAVTLTQSTVTENHALDAAANPAMGGGVFQFNTGSNHPFSISGSIVAGNTAGGSGPDLVKDPQSTLTVNYSLIGTGITPTAGGNNVVTNAPQLGPLANNAGPTQTHALFAGNPAIDAGDPSIVFDPAEFDQRGAPFVRVYDGDGIGGARIDIGAYERQTLAASILVVTTTADKNDVNYSAADLSLREAINLSHASIGPDTITFDAALSGATITLGGTELSIDEALVIDARPLAANVTIDANQLSRIFNITDMGAATTGDFTFGGLTLTGGRTTAVGSTGGGGAIRSLTFGNLTLDQSTVSGNSTTGFDAHGGGIWAYRAVTLTQSTISGNRTLGFGAEGGGIYARRAVTLTQSTVSGNSTADAYADGGGIRAVGNVTLDHSTVSGNSTEESVARGGGIFAGGAVELTQSTVSGNSTGGGSANGGGIFSSGAVTLTQSTVSGNSTAGGDGGGIWVAGAVTLTQSTVTDNHVFNATGGGVFQFNTSINNFPFSISGSVVAGNTAGGGADLVKDPESTLFVIYSLIGVAPVGMVGVGNITGLDPLFGPLANNGGPTETRALLPGSPAINAGDPSIAFNPAEHDQRGAPFARVSGGRIDMGAFEVQSIIVPPDLPGDYNLNGVVDAADYVVWRKTLGTNVAPPFTGADGDGDTTIDQDDYGVWRAHFGQTLGVGNGAGALGTEAGGGQSPFSVTSTAAPTRNTIMGTDPAVLAEPVALDEEFRISDFGFRIEESRETRVKSREPSLGATIFSETLPRDDALLAWLSSRDSERREYAGEGVDIDGQDFPSYGEAADEAIDALDGELRTLVAIEML